MAKSPDAVANRSTPEYLAFRKCYRSVRIHITPQIEDIHDALFEKGYIPPSVQDYAATDAIPKEMKARSLVDTVIKKIELDPEVFHGFVSILKNEGPSADSIVEQLGEVFKAEQALVYCDHSSEDSYHSLSGTDSSVEGTMKMSDPQKMNFSKTMTCSELCKWLAEWQLPESVVAVIREQDVDGDSFLQLSSLSKEDLSKTLDTNITYGAYKQLKPVLIQAEACEEQRKSTNLDLKFICPFCKKCTVMQFFSEAGCPMAPQHNSSERVSLFPYLDYSALTRNEKIVIESRLIDDTKKMICLYANTEDSLIMSLSSKNIDVPRLRNYAGNFISEEGTEEQVGKLKQSSTISEIFDALYPFKSFFHYEVIENIVQVFGSFTDHKLMDEYILKFNEFCERSVFQVPPNIFRDSDPKPGDKVFQVKFLKKGQTSLRDIASVRRRVASILGIEVFALQLCCITDGCVCLRFLIFAKVAEKVFPLSQSQVRALQDIQIRIVDSPNPLKEEDQVIRSKVGKLELFKTQAAVPTLTSSTNLKQQTEDFIDACEAGEIDKLIDIYLKNLRIDGKAATELRAAVMKEVIEGNLSFISQLVRESGINLDQGDSEYGWTALHFACQNCNDQVVKILISAKADLNFQTYEGITALHLASLSGHVTTVQILVEAGAVLNVQLKNGRTALWQACAYRHHKVVELLTNAGAAVDVQAKNGWTALHVACQTGNDEIVETLMRAKADLNLQTDEGFTALHLASEEGHVTVVQLLNEAGASLDVQTNEGFTALHLASEEGHVTVVQLLIEAGASLDVQTNDGCTALYQASANGHHEVVDQLTDAGAAVDVQNKSGRAALHVACEKIHVQVVKILMRAKADLNLQTNNEGGTALHLASSNGHLTTVMLLIRAGAYLDVQICNGWTALDIAAKFQGADSVVYQTLARAGAKSGKQLSGSAATHHFNLQNSSHSTSSEEKTVYAADHGYCCL